MARDPAPWRPPMSETAAEPQTLARVILHPSQEKRLLTGHELGLCFYHPNSLIAGRMLTRSPKDVIDAEFFRKRLSDALAYRERVCPGENAYRLCFGESDGIPGLVVDRYGSV